MQYSFYTCDVFTDVRFGGNPLAVLPDAEGLSTAEMQSIAREFNYSETSFVCPARQGQTRYLRIFTPAQEVPFAGHPNIGTAFVLASMGQIDASDSTDTIVFEQAAGHVEINIGSKNGEIWSELKAPQPLSIGEPVDLPLVAQAISLDVDTIITKTHPPQLVSVGLPFILVEIEDIENLSKARVNLPAFEAIHAQGIMPDILLYVRSNNRANLRVRMFAPLDGVNEDPATGSANCALTALLSFHDPLLDGEFSWQISQGSEMGRPSTLEARVNKQNGKISDVYIGGACCMVSQGHILV